MTLTSTQKDWLKVGVVLLFPLTLAVLLIVSLVGIFALLAIGTADHLIETLFPTRDPR